MGPYSIHYTERAERAGTISRTPYAGHVSPGETPRRFREKAQIACDCGGGDEMRTSSPEFPAQRATYPVSKTTGVDRG